MLHRMSTPVETLRGKQGLAARSEVGLVRSEVACRVCSGEEYENFLEARGYRVVQCKNCGLWFVNPQPTAEELAQFHASYDDGEHV